MITKKCPFCDSKPDIIKRKNNLWDIGCSNFLCYAWICLDKECNDCTDGYKNKDDAILSWNKRGK
jgi:hypothetical protein